MAVQTYENYLIFSQPSENVLRGRWQAHASVTWFEEDGAHYHTFEIAKAFDSEASALVFGFMIARAWINDKLLNLAS
jgi:hypothetical protein